MISLYKGLLILGVTLGIGVAWNFLWSKNRLNDYSLDASATVTAQFERARPSDPIFTTVGKALSGRETAQYKFSSTYVTANDDYAVQLYWHNHYRRLYVTAPKGINVYETDLLTGKVRHVKQGAAVAVTQVVKHGATTRYRLADGQYITGNKQYVSPVKSQAVKPVRSKTTVRRYEDVNLTKVVTTYQKGTTPRARAMG